MTHSGDSLHTMRQRMRDHIQALTGGEPTRGMELMSILRMVNGLLETILAQHSAESGLSASRWGILMHLLAEEQRGNLDGLTPTYLSRCRNVGKNTMSALLKGLEEQGLIRRKLDAADKRIFRIQLTPAGRELIAASLPPRIQRSNELIADLSAEEQEALLALLEKLFLSLKAHGGITSEQLHQHLLRRERK